MNQFKGAFGHASVSKNFTNLPGHTHVRITARVHFLDMWVGDLLYMKAAGGILRWSKAHWFCTSTPEKSCQPGSIGSGKFFGKMEKMTKKKIVFRKEISVNFAVSLYHFIIACNYR